MSRYAAPHTPPSAGARPLFADYLLLMCGISLSVLIAGLGGVQTHAKTLPQTRLGQSLLATHPFMLFSHIGVVLLWPMFYLTQQLTGRKQPLTVAEWLWGVAWLGVLVFCGWLVWNGVGTLPEFMANDGFRRAVMVGYIVAVVATALIALVLLVVDLLARWPSPWTHQFALALFIWPVAPLATMWIWGLELRIT